MYTLLAGGAPHHHAPALGAVLRRREVEVQADATGDVAGLLQRRRPRLAVRLGVGLGLGAVPAHVAAERLADGELEPADGALVHPRLGRGPLWRRRQQRLAPEAELRVVGRSILRRRRRLVEQPGPLVAGTVAPERLERGELPAARLALEHAPVPAAPRRHHPRWERRRPVPELQEAPPLLLLLRLREEHEQAGRVRDARLHLPRRSVPLGHDQLCASSECAGHGGKGAGIVVYIAAARAGSAWRRWSWMPTEQPSSPVGPASDRLPCTYSAKETGHDYLLDRLVASSVHTW